MRRMDGNHCPYHRSCREPSKRRCVCRQSNDLSITNNIGGDGGGGGTGTTHVSNNTIRPKGWMVHTHTPLPPSCRQVHHDTMNPIRYTTRIPTLDTPQLHHLLHGRHWRSSPLCVSKKNKTTFVQYSLRNANRHPPTPIECTVPSPHLWLPEEVDTLCAALRNTGTTLTKP